MNAHELTTKTLEHPEIHDVFTIPICLRNQGSRLTNYGKCCLMRFVRIIMQ